MAQRLHAPFETLQPPLVDATISLWRSTRITSDPKIMFGKPVIPELPSRHILRCLAAGETPDDIVSDYPPLTREDISAAQAFAADHLAREAVFSAE
jgi:uncharacterized protein (DUF433 family)